MMSLVLRTSLLGLFFAVTACGSERKDPPTETTAVAEAKPSASVTGSASGGAAVVDAPKAPVTFELVGQFADQTEPPVGVWVLGEQLVVSSRNRVGKIEGGKLEWVAKTEGVMPGGGANLITTVWGRSLDEIDVTERSDNGRIGSELYGALKGKANPALYGPGGARGSVHGYAWVGESMVIQGSDWEGPRIHTARGPRIERFSVPETSVGCEKSTFTEGALDSWAFGGARNGMLVSAGTYCKTEGPAVEVWAPDETKGKIVPLDEHLAKDARFEAVVPYGADGVLLMPWRSNKILLYKQGAVSVFAELDGYDSSFVTAKGQVFVNDGKQILELSPGQKTVVGTLAWPAGFRNMVHHGGEFWASAGGVYKLVPGKGVAFSPDCKTPFVMLYDVKPDVEPTFTFPATRKALGSFAQAKDIQLVEFIEGRRRLGVVVPSREVGDAVIAHVKANMKDEDPKLLCYAPKSPKTHAIVK